MRDFLYRLLSAIILVILVIGVIWFILPDTVFSYPIEKLWSFCATIFHWQEYYRKGLQTEGAIAIFFGGYLLLLILLIIYGFCHFVLWDRISPTSHFTNAFALLSSCYLLDFFVSTADPYPFGELLWVFMVFSSFFLTMLYIGEEWALLLKILVIAIGEQCLYAIIYYFLSFNQFHTPDFGNRTSGTFVNPGSLYPLCLIGFPISLILAEMEKSLHWRWLWRAIGGVSLLALTFTFTRTGWIAFAVSAGYLAFSPFSPLRSQRPARLMLVLLIVLALSGTAFVRTMGRPVGNPEDRSFWGRFAIWQTALHVIADHPLLGNGLNTYPQKQREHMTERLKYFNPLNVEAKNLYLHLAAELGLIGLAVFCWVAWRYYQLFRFVIGTFPPSSDLYKIAIGIHAALIGIAVAGLADTPILHHSRSAATFAVACLLGLLCSSVNHACPAPVVDDDTLRKRRQRFWRGVGFVVVASCLPITYFSWHVGVGVKKAFEAFPKVQELAFRLPKATSYVRLKEIAPVMRDAVVASEDGYFYFHHGVDWLALHRALRKNIRALRFKQGGSTITMQLARYLFLGRERTLARKVAEIILALKMEQLLPKDRILELYLNTARFGMGEDGLFAAAQNYFGKQPKDLNLAEAAFLAGVLPEPPFDQRNVTPELVRRCQRRAFERLRAFFPERYPPEVIQEAQKTPLKFRWGTVVILSEGVNENGGH